MEEGVSAREDNDSDKIGSKEAGSGSVEGSDVAVGLDSDETSLSACFAMD